MSDVIRAEMRRLAAAHKGYGLKSALARATGATPTSTGEWLDGRTAPTERWWPKIEQFFELPAGHLAELAGQHVTPLDPPDDDGDYDELRSLVRALGDAVSRLEARLDALEQPPAAPPPTSEPGSSEARPPVRRARNRP